MRRLGRQTAALARASGSRAPDARGVPHIRTSIGRHRSKARRCCACRAARSHWRASCVVAVRNSEPCKDCRGRTDVEVPCCADPEDFSHPARIQLLGRQRIARGLRASLHTAQLSQVERVQGRQHCVWRHFLSRTRSHRRRDCAQLRLFKRPVGNPDGWTDHLSHRLADQLLRRALWPGHGSADPRRGLRLPRLDGDLADLCELHLHLFCARGRHPGAGAADDFRLAAGGVLSGRLARRGAAGDVRHHRDLETAAVDAANLDRSRAAALHRRAAQKPPGLSRFHDAGRWGLGKQWL